jgi:acetyl-CoA C-acetyltransferase
MSIGGSERKPTMLKQVLLAGGVRTAIGTFGGAFAEVRHPKLGAAAIKAALQRSGVPADQIDEVIFGNVVSAGLGQNVARQCSLGAGLSNTIGATTVNKVCGIGLKAVMLAAQAIQCGDASAIVAGGTENMSRAPYLLEKARNGYRMGNGEIVDAMIRDGLWDVYNNVHMGTCGDACAKKYEFTASSRTTSPSPASSAPCASSSGAFATRSSPSSAPAGKATVQVTEDENPRSSTRRSCGSSSRLRQGRHDHAGNASSINDGAAAIVVLSARKPRPGVKPQARILGYATAPRSRSGSPRADRCDQPADGSVEPQVSDVDLFEINEAFSVVPMAAMKDLSIPHEKVNVNGGAIALGHPIGASGARTLVTLLNAMRSARPAIGIDSLCIGGGEASRWRWSYCSARI